jgi:hypothetical protein
MNQHVWTKTPDMDLDVFIRDLSLTDNYSKNGRTLVITFFMNLRMEGHWIVVILQPDHIFINSILLSFDQITTIIICRGPILKVVFACGLFTEGRFLIWRSNNEVRIAFRKDDVTTGAALYFLINELLVCSDKTPGFVTDLSSLTRQLASSWYRSKPQGCSITTLLVSILISLTSTIAKTTWEQRCLSFKSAEMSRNRRSLSEVPRFTS